MSLIEISGEIIRRCNSGDVIFVVGIFNCRAAVMVLAAGRNRGNLESRAGIRVDHVDHPKLKPLASEDCLILMGVSRIVFIAGGIASASGKCVGGPVDCSGAILDLEVEFGEELVPAGLIAVEFSGLGEVLQVLVISEDSDRFCSFMGFRAPFFE